MSSLICLQCNHSVSINLLKCTCDSSVPDFRSRSSRSQEYEQLYSDIATGDLVTSIQPYEQKTIKANYDLGVIEGHLTNKERPRILEIGPGSGALSLALSSLGDLFITDITVEYLSEIAFCEQKFLSNVEDLPFQNTFDLIVLCDVLEHVLNEGDAILSIQRALKPGGLMYVRCPANEPLISYAQKVGSPYPYVHLRTYDPRRFRALAYHGGFDVVRTKFLPSSAIGFARRNFGIPSLAVTRSQRHTLEVMHSFGTINFHVGPHGIDRLLTFVESAMWYVTRRFKLDIFNRVINRLWYKPSEVYLLARKNPSLSDLSTQLETH